MKYSLLSSGGIRGTSPGFLAGYGPCFITDLAGADHRAQSNYVIALISYVFVVWLKRSSFSHEGELSLGDRVCHRPRKQAAVVCT